MQRGYTGGLQSRERLVMLHGHPDVPHSAEVGSTGVFLAELPRALEGALASDHPYGSFKFYVGQMEWAAGELDQQVEAGAWLPAAASRAVVLKQCIGLPVPLWREILLLMGGEYAELVEEGP